MTRTEERLIKLEAEVAELKKQLSRIKKDRPNPATVNPYDLAVRRKLMK